MPHLSKLKFDLYLSLHVYQTCSHKDESLHKPNSKYRSHQ